MLGLYILLYGFQDSYRPHYQKSWRHGKPHPFSLVSCSTRQTQTLMQDCFDIHTAPIESNASSPFATEIILLMVATIDDNRWLGLVGNKPNIQDNSVGPTASSHYCTSDTHRGWLDFTHVTQLGLTTLRKTRPLMSNGLDT